MHSSLHSTPCSWLRSQGSQRRVLLNSRQSVHGPLSENVHEHRGVRCLAQPSQEPGEPAQQGCEVRFAIQKRVAYKEVLNIVGSAEELGNWKRVPGAMLRMKWSEGDVWRAETWLPARPIEYKYLVTSDQGEFKEWQGVPKNQFVVPNPKVIALDISDDWYGDGEGTVTEILAPSPQATGEATQREPQFPSPSPSGSRDSAAAPSPAPAAAAAAQQPVSPQQQQQPGPNFTSPTLDKRGMEWNNSSGNNGNGKIRRGASNLSPLPPLNYQQQQQQHMNGVPGAREHMMGTPRQQQVPGQNGGSAENQPQPQSQQEQQQPQQQARPFFDVDGVIADPNSWNGSGEEDEVWDYTDKGTKSSSNNFSEGSNGNKGPVRNSSGHDLGNAYTKRYKLPRSKLKVLAVDDQTGAITSRFQHMAKSELQRELKKRYLPVYGGRDALLRRLHGTIGIDGGVPRRS